MRIVRLAGPYRSKFFLAIALAILMGIFSTVNPFLVQVTVDKYILPGNFQMVIDMTILILISLLIQAFLSYRFTYLTSWLGQSIVKNLRSKVFNHIVNLNLSHFDRTPIGTLTTRAINDVETINDIFSEGVIAIFADMLTIICVLSYMFWQSWSVSLVCLAVVPVLIYATYLFKEGIRVSFTEVRNQVARLNAFTQEHISGMLVVQTFTAEEREMKKFLAINKAHADANIRSNFYYSIFFPVVEILSASSIGLLVWYGASQVLQAHIEVGVIISFIMCINLLYRPIRMLADKFNTLQMGMVASDRVFKLIDHKNYMSNEGKLIAHRLRGDIEFQHVSFAYEEENYVLKDVSFKVNAGQTLAIVGATGSGKTTIISLLNRFYENQKGEILIDGKNIREYELHSLRENLGLVLQDVFLFAGTIMDNIRLRNEHISEERVKEAARICGIHDFIEKLPGGYNYEVMERGASLSFGQRQLISFVRALVFNPSILILDEATSSIDTESERLIQHAIEKLVKGRTSIVIAHRLSTIRNADLILVIDKGEVKEAGTHNELIALNNLYAKLYEMQFKKGKETVIQN
jgi:ATP-binding cassette, subfamily B, multidrug efflux pump